MFYFELLPGRSEIRFVNGGHMPPIIIKNNKVVNFIVYSDGHTEARNEKGKLFKITRLYKLLPSPDVLNVDVIGRIIIEEAEKSIGCASWYDDFSLIIIKNCKCFLSTKTFTMYHNTAMFSLQFVCNCDR